MKTSKRSYKTAQAAADACIAEGRKLIGTWCQKNGRYRYDYWIA